MIEFKPLNDVYCELSEGPTYDDRSNALFHVDILAKAVHRVDLDSLAHRKWSFPSEVGSIGLTETGRLVVALRHSVGIFDTGTEQFTKLGDIEADQGPTTRLNDGKVGPDGAFWVGSMDDREPEKHAIGALYRVTPDGRIERKVEGLVISNGLAWSPDGKHMFHTDVRAGWLDRWDFDAKTGNISNRTRIALFDNEIGRPDGGAVDVDGNYWSAGISSQRLNRFSPDGKLLESYPVPVLSPTMPCFAGPDMKTLIVTNLTVGRSKEALAPYPMSGHVLIGRSPVAGTAAARFRDR